ncbi:hypothetical protein [Luteibacter sp. 9135]|uniref:hypothetical protein n=1 Tax=Luteibacter sp. 9135 TaxID=1500893 RepID=UPI0005629E0C|nr:hypothetical protein [Luteibacter sp. 9135]
MKDHTPPRTLCVTIDDDGIHIDATYAEDLPIALEAAQRMTVMPPATPSRDASRVAGKNHDARSPASTSMRLLSSPDGLDDGFGPFSPETAADSRAHRQHSLLDDDWLYEHGRGLEIEDIKARAAALASGSLEAGSLEGGADDELDESWLDPADPQTAALLRHEAHIRSLIGPDDDEEWEEEMDGPGNDDDEETDSSPSIHTASFGVAMALPSTRLH